MKTINKDGVQEFDFAWTMKFLGITNKEIIKKYRVWNKEQFCGKDDENKQENKNIIKKDIAMYPFKIYANKRFRGSHAGHYLPLENIVEIKEKIDEESPSFWQKSLIAHEFAHALIGGKKIIGNRVGHGVLYYHCLLRDVIWYANNFTLFEKFRALNDEFSYSCSLGQYRGTNRIFRSQSCRISLDLEWFTINNLFFDNRSDINNLGKWIWEKICEQIGNIENKQELLDTPIVDLIRQIEKTGNDKIVVVKTEEELKMLRR